MNDRAVNAMDDTTYVEEITATLRELLRDVIRQREPDVLSVIDQVEAVATIPPHLIEHALQAIGIWLQLQNIAEENASIRNRRNLERQCGPDQVIGSLSHAFAQIAAADVPQEAVQKMLAMADVQPTITAHPTEAKRVTVLEIHRRIYVQLFELESPRWTPRERQTMLDHLRNEIDLLWMTGEIRIEKPTVESEISWGLHFFREALFDRTTTICDLLEESLRRHYPDLHMAIRPPLRFSSWIGGDRDGNPFVTVPTTRFALKANREAAVARLDKRLMELSQLISVSATEVVFPEAFTASLKEQRIAAAASEELILRNPAEPFRQYLSALRLRLAATFDPKPHVKPLANVQELVDQLSYLETILAEMKASRLAADLVRPVRWEAQIFGFRTVSLDIRQNTTIINRVLQEIWGKMNPLVDSPAPDSNSPEWSAWIFSELEKPLGFTPQFRGVSEEARELLDLLVLIRETLDGPDPQAIGTFILSMTKRASDIFGLYLLAKYCGLFTDVNARETCRLRVVPLFETIEDLQAAPAILTEMLENPILRQSVAAQGLGQEIMLGYSDSNKDGGFFSASFELFEAQRRLLKIGRKAHVDISFFHGRGGSVSRGGAPTGRAIGAQPAGTVGGRMRVTEQGEVVSSKFANRGTAQNNLEVLTSSVFLHSLKSTKEPELIVNPEHQAAVEDIARLSFKAYRRLAEDKALLAYFHSASPVEELAQLKLGSRPARRFGAKGIEDLRAIPWVFAWSQNRHLLTGWYGLGYALDDYVSARGGQGLALLKDMFAKSRGFRLAVDEVEKSLFLADMSVAEKYAELVPDRNDAERVFAMIRHEHARTSKVVLELNGAKVLCERFTGFRRRFERLRPMVDQANLWQVQLLRETRAGKSKSEINKPLLMTMNCVAQGLGWTG